MSNVQHNSLDTSNLHKAAYWGSDPGAVGAGIFWVDTAHVGAYVLKVRNQPNNGWDTVCADLLSDGTNTTTAAGVAGHIADATKHRQINDSSTSATDLWSASKTNTALTTHTGNAAIHRQINDSGTGATDLFSAQHVLSLLNAIVPIGIIVPWPSNTIPGTNNTTSGSTWLVCDGRVFNTSNYAALYSVIGTSWGTQQGNVYLPDMRGVTLRGRDSSAGRDTQAASRTVSRTGGASGDNAGSFQWDSLGAHCHNFNMRTRVNASDQWGATVSGYRISGMWNAGDVEEARTTGPNLYASETAMRNVSVTWMIRAS
jgi:microcystin-dependent protein